MPRATKPKATTVHQIKVTLKGIRPPIWRRLQVPSDIRLSELHDVIQVAMGWTDSHLHQFSDGRNDYGAPMDVGFDDPDTLNEARYRLDQVAPKPKDKLIYEYDFGDGWTHEILVEKVLPIDPAATYPVCLTGKRACPPEDCGGIWGYAQLLETLADPENPEYEEMKEWAGEIDPDHFDLAATNRRLKGLGTGSGGRPRFLNA